MVRRFANASYSLIGVWMASGFAIRIPGGTVASISASRESYPSSSSIAAASPDDGPMCRGTKLAASRAVIS
jgi:hypothetical protein